jgi:hypothetical protein
MSAVTYRTVAMTAHPLDDGELNVTSVGVGRPTP